MSRSGKSLVFLEQKMTCDPISCRFVLHEGVILIIMVVNRPRAYLLRLLHLINSEPRWLIKSQPSIKYRSARKKDREISERCRVVRGIQGVIRDSNKDESVVVIWWALLHLFGLGGGGSLDFMFEVTKRSTGRPSCYSFALPFALKGLFRFSLLTIF